jgi:hypothetical protein
MARRRLQRRPAIIERSIELGCLFFLGFALASLVGIAVAWMFGLHHGEPNPWDDGTRSIPSCIGSGFA